MEQLQRTNLDLLTRLEKATESYQELAKNVQQWQSRLSIDTLFTVFEDLAEREGATFDQKRKEFYTPGLEHGMYGGFVKGETDA